MSGGGFAFGRVIVASVLSVFLAALLAATISTPAWTAQKKAKQPDQKPAMTFLGVKVKPHTGFYLVLKDVNIRAKPKTKSKKIASLKAGKRIRVVAKTAGAWVAVREGGKDLGFVFGQYLMPQIDGKLEKDIKGKAQVTGGADCDFNIHFEGKSPVEGELFEIADYDVLWNCRQGSRKVKFQTPMFITEAPFQLGSKRIYQISIDILDLDGGYEEVFSTTVLYDEDKAKIVFDGVSIKKYGQPPKLKEAPAKSVAQALAGAAGIALSAWNQSAWTDLIKSKP